MTGGAPRVAITTSADRFAETAPAFRSVGLEPVGLPCVGIEPAPEAVLGGARGRAEGADLLILTSRRPLDLLWGDGAMPAVPVAAVGKRTAEAVRSRGGNVAAVGSEGIGELIDRIGDQIGSLTVAYPHAAGTDRAVLAVLRRRAGRLDAVEVYNTFPIAPGPDPVDAVALASPSAVEGWLLSRSFDALTVGVIGPTTAAAFSRIRPPDLVSPLPSFTALAEAMAHHLEV